MPSKTPIKPRQRGGFVIGLVVGLLIGLALSLGVALYITKVPVPFINKVPQRTPEQDAAEIEKNRNWDPNSPLYGRNPARPASTPMTSPPPAAVMPPPAATTTPPATTAASPPTAASTARRDTRDPAAILGDKPAATASAAPVVATARQNSADPFSYFVQAGAYGRTEEAEQQRAKLAMLGLTAKVTEREQSGRTVYRVRVGPYDRKEDADAAKEKLDGNSIEAALVRVQK